MQKIIHSTGPVPCDFALIAERLWPRVIKRDSGCWEWQGYRNPKGYGQIGTVGSRTIFVHRLSWLIHFGDIPENLFVLHHCDNPPCVNPAHLFIGTKKDNSKDASRKGRIHRAGLAVRWNYFRSRTECPRGHAYTTENTYVNPSTGKRDCLTCKKICKRNWDKINNAHVRIYRRKRYVELGK